jgi:gliding motility-associated-like protein
MLSLLALKVCSQSFYVVNTNTQIKKITIINGVVTQTDITSCDNDAFSIAILNNKFYSVSAKLTTSTISGNSLINCSSIPLSLGGFTSLTASTNGLLYGVQNNSLYTIDPTNGALNKLGNMPYTSAGDLIFYRNLLYMASPQGIVKVDPFNPSASTLIIPYSINIWGLAVTADSNGSYKVYALSADPATNIYEVDIENRRLGNVVATLPYVVLDAASTVESGTPTRDIADVTFPNTFTPNGDGINDLFAPIPNDPGTNLIYRIYNRYGTLLFSSDKSSGMGWNGQYKGKEVPVGVYYWMASYNGGKSPAKGGYVTLIR